MEVGGRRGRTLLHDPFRAPRGDADRLRALRAAQAAAVAEQEVEGVLTVALEHAMSFAGLPAGAASVITPNGDRVLVRAVVGNTAAGGLERLAPGTVLRGPLAILCQQAMDERRPQQHPVPRNDQPPPPPPGHPASYTIVPLIGSRQRVLGSLALFSVTHQQPLAPEDVDVLLAMAGQVAPAVESAQLHEQLERTLDELLTLYGAGQAISSSLEIPEVLAGILEMSRRLASADCCLIVGPDRSGNLAVLAESGATPEWLAYRTTPGVRLTINAVLRDGSLRPLGIPPVTGWCIGLKVRQHVIGALEVYSRGGPARNDASHLLTGLATQAAIAIENAKLYQAVREKEASLQDLIERMIQAQEEDRRRVAYDIHDGLAQLMVSAHQHLQTFGLLHARKDPKSDQALAKGLFMLQKSIEEVRKVIAGLRPSELDDFGLVAAIQLYVQTLRDDFGWQVELLEDVGSDRLPAPVEVTAYRIIQEALTNARRHGDAGRARVELKRESSWLQVTVQDWGRGFDVDGLLGRAAHDGEAGRHVGLHGMRERAHLLGGTFEVESTPGEGTVVRVRMPIHESTRGEDSSIAPAYTYETAYGPVEVPADGDVSSGGAVGGWPAAEARPAPLDGQHNGGLPA